MNTAELLGFDRYIQPFASAKGSEILIGVNYASGGAGIRDETGQQLVNKYVEFYSKDLFVSQEMYHFCQIFFKKMTSSFGVWLKLKN